MNRFVLLAVACFSVTCLGSCALVGSLLQSILRVPGSILQSVTEAETPDATGEQPAPAQPEAVPVPDRLSDGVLVVTPLD